MLPAQGGFELNLKLVKEGRSKLIVLCPGRKEALCCTQSPFAIDFDHPRNPRKENSNVDGIREPRPVRAHEPLKALGVYKWRVLVHDKDSAAQLWLFQKFTS